MLKLEQQREFLIRSAENHEVMAAGMRGKADCILTIIDALMRDLDGWRGSRDTAVLVRPFYMDWVCKSMRGPSSGLCLALRLPAPGRGGLGDLVHLLAGVPR